MKEFKTRCHKLGKLMTSPKSKGEVLSQTAKTCIKEQAIEYKYGIKKDFSSRYTDKGLLQEELAIEMASQVLNLPFALKNTEYFENEFIKGTPDLILEDEIIDIKCSWDGTTFPWFEDELPNKDYFWQLVGYMWLTGRSKARVVYCLVDTPEDIVQDEIRRTSWKKFEIDVTEETENEVRAKHEFSHISENKRVRAFQVELNDANIEQVKEKLLHAREYYNELIERL
jgi:hypothetical protein